MFDVFYQGPKPGLFPFELPARDLDHAAQLSRTKFFWFIDGNNDYSEFDFDQRPLPWQSEFVHVWPSQWQTSGGTYLANIHTVKNQNWHFRDDVNVSRRASLENWCIPESIDAKSFDFSWHPNPLDPPYVYHFPSQHQSSSGVTYTVPGATEIKLSDAFVVRSLPRTEHWYIPEYINSNTLDYTWHPNPLDPPYVYHFPSQHQSSSGVTYTVPGATEIKLTDAFMVQALPRQYHWSVPEEVNSLGVDYTWHPNPLDPAYIYHFGTEFQQSVGLTYMVPGATEIKFFGPIPNPKQHDKPVLEVLDIFFIDKNNASAKTRYERLQQRYPDIHRVRYANSIIDTIRRCLTRSETSKFWVISSENIYDDFDFTWHAQPWQSYMTHVFGSQWQKWSDTFLINRHEFQRHTQWAGSIEQFPNLNFVKDQPVMIPDDLHDIYWVSHGNATDQYQRLNEKYPDIRSTRFVDSYLETLRRIMATVTTEYVWVISSLCDYTRFDFSWQPEPWQREMMHVFPSGQQTRGDTFYIHVPSFQKQMQQLELLDWFNTVNYCSEQIVPRLPKPVVRYTTDSAVDVLKNHNFENPYTWFVPDHEFVQDHALVYEPAIWYAKDKKIHTFSRGNSVILAPRDVKIHINTQAYDYPYIDKQRTIKEPDLDVIYISNGEPDAERWYEHLCNIAGRHVKRVQNVVGRTASQHAAAKMAQTSWYFVVTAKLEIIDDFDWSWQPDRLQEAKHYIFHSRNPVNGLEYGHMGVVAYNRQLVLETDAPGLDFTLSKPHAVVPVLSAVAHYNTTPELTWRAAFREVVKLRDHVEKTDSIESRYRLNLWLSEAQGQHAEWSLQGAADAVKYYDTVAGDYQQLLKTFEWAWLRNFWLSQHLA
jgi:hypothetical protein